MAKQRKPKRPTTKKTKTTKRAAKREPKRASKSKDISFAAADLFAVPLDAHTYAFGRIVYTDKNRGTFIEIFEKTSEEPTLPSNVIDSGVLLGPTAVGGLRTFGRGRWPIIGRDPGYDPSDLRAYRFWAPSFERDDEYVLTSIVGDNARPATKAETEGLEEHAIRSPATIENRIRERLGKPRIDYDDRSEKPAEARSELAPFKLIEYGHDPGSFGLMLTDQHMGDVADVFEAEGREGNGHDWDAVARQVVHLHPELGKKFDTDPEAGMFVARARDRGSLETLGRELHRAFHDRARLRELVRAAVKRRSN